MCVCVCVCKQSEGDVVGEECEDASLCAKALREEGAPHKPASIMLAALLCFA